MGRGEHNIAERARVEYTHHHRLSQPAHAAAVSSGTVPIQATKPTLARASLNFCATGIENSGLLLPAITSTSISPPAIALTRVSMSSGELAGGELAGAGASSAKTTVLPTL